MLMPNFAYVRVKSLKEGIQHLSSDGARIHAGGTDLLGCLRDRVFDAAALVSLSEVADLRGVRRALDGGLVIGALTTLAEIASNPEILASYPTLAQGAASAASPPPTA